MFIHMFIHWRQTSYLVRQRREELEQQQEEKLELEEKYSSTEEQVWLIYPSEKPLKNHWKTTENLKILPLWKPWKPLLVDDGWWLVKEDYTKIYGHHI